MTAQNFAYWYITLFLLSAGAAGMFFHDWLGSLKRTFWRELRDPVKGPRLRAVLERREQLEALGGRPVFIGGACYVFFGILCAAHVVTPAAAYALACVDSALVMATSFSRVRNRSDRRAASLSPRRETSVVPLLAYAGALACAFLPVLLIPDGSVRFAAILVSAGSISILAAAWWTAGMAAVMTGDDADFEVYAEERLRRSRVSGMLSLSYAIVPVFFAIAEPSVSVLPSASGAQWISVVLTLSYLAWFWVDRLRSRLPKTKSAVV